MVTCPRCKVELVSLENNKVQCPKCKCKATTTRVYSSPTLSCPDPTWITFVDWEG